MKLKDKARVVRRIKDIGVVPVVRTASADEAVRAVEAIHAGGLPIAEITMTVPGAVKVIERLTRLFGDDVCLGAGTVVDSEVAHDCVEAGARFIVSPVLQADTITFCTMRDIAVIPGALTPSEIVHAADLGADFIKVFPAAALGGASYIRALKAPFPELELMATGGVTLDNVADYIEAGASAVGAGSDLVDAESLRNGHFDKITRAARAYVEAVRFARRGDPSLAPHRARSG